MPIEITASVAITADPCNPTPISIESSMTPAPDVPPATRPQPNDAPASERSESFKPRFAQLRRSGTLAMSIAPITTAAPRPLSRL
jgi:hypothetical protein